MIEKTVIIPPDQAQFTWKMDDFTSSPVVKSFMAGAISGTCSTLLFQPLDLVKTRLQKSANLGNKLGMFDEIANVVRQEKVLGLWTGLVPSLLRCVPGIGLYFASLHWLKSSFGTEAPHPVESVAMGASARTITGITVLPFTVLKTRYESGEFHYKSLMDGIRSTYAKEGFKALYSGLAPTLLRDVPFSGIYLMFYTQMKSLTAEGRTHSAVHISFVNGIVAGSLASFVTQPADVIKTNMQLYPTKYGRLKTVVMLVYTERGFIGFWRGLVPRMLRRTLMSAMSWTVYEEIMRACNIKT
ncbi:unnamed protein product [Candidula unifasciata]|uniref:Mitochondrial glycine transporter n=1 Tax=Candidula unifasciata TaxID=100452 RepID=A0A8S3ZLH9_9EUPU|nr:unnamed protein product [Candidula unifasciata]